MTHRKNSTGRPKKAPDEQRSESLPPLRLTTAERAFVEGQAAQAGLSLSDYCRRLILGSRVRASRATADEAALVELNRVGVNLNQIAHRLNASGKPPRNLPEVLDEVRAAVERVAGAEG